MKNVVRVLLTIVVVVIMMVLVNPQSHVETAKAEDGASCSIQVTLGNPPNHGDVGITGTDGDYVFNFGDGSPSPTVTVSGGQGHTDHDYNYLGGPFTISADGPAHCEANIVVPGPDENPGGEGEGGSGEGVSGGSGASQPFGYPVGAWQCENLVNFQMDGNLLTVSGEVLRDKLWIHVDTGNGVTFDLFTGFDGTYRDSTYYDLSKPGRYLVTVSILGTNIVCATYEVVIGDPSTFESVDTQSVDAQPTESSQTGTSQTCDAFPVGSYVQVKPNSPNVNLRSEPGTAGGNSTVIDNLGRQSRRVASPVTGCTTLDDGSWLAVVIQGSDGQPVTGYVAAWLVQTAVESSEYLQQPIYLVSEPQVQPELAVSAPVEQEIALSADGWTLELADDGWHLKSGDADRWIGVCASAENVHLAKQDNVLQVAYTLQGEERFASIYGKAYPVPGCEA